MPVDPRRLDPLRGRPESKRLLPNLKEHGPVRK
jgi:hypothetical protein